jgi:hypothetical protein
MLSTLGDGWTERHSSHDIKKSDDGRDCEVITSNDENLSRKISGHGDDPCALVVERQERRRISPKECDSSIV